MRLAHITDLHVERPMKAGDLVGKRVFGAVNLHIFGWRRHFSKQVQEALPAAVLASRPDHVLCTGDLTATATVDEFAAAAELLAPLKVLPFHCIPGNHDVYTAESLGRYETFFGDTSVRREPCGPVDLVLIDVCVPDWLSRGRASEDTLRALDAALTKPGACIVGLHYPLRDRRGAPYGPPARALSNAAEVERILDRHPNVVAVLHGHEHHGFRAKTAGGITIFDPGACGYAYLPNSGRTAHYNVYEIDTTGIVAVERFAWSGRAFEPETGGAYASGG